MVDTLVGAEESRAKQLENHTEQLLRCIESDQIALLSTSIYTLQGPKQLEATDFRKISKYVLGSFKDDQRGFERVVDEVIDGKTVKIDERKVYLVIDCSDPGNLNSAADSMAAYLYYKPDPRVKDEKKGERVWPGSWIPRITPALIPESADEKEVVKIKARLSFKVFELLKADPSRVELLLYTPFVFPLQVGQEKATASKE